MNAPAQFTQASQAVSAGSLALVAIAFACSACGGSKGAQSANAQSVERQAEAEYDVARDSFYKGHPREALDHVLKSVEMDDSNPKSLYFTSTVYLWFCSTNEGMTSPDCRLKDAEDFARRAMKADDAFRDARNLLGNVLILEKRYKDAIEILEPLTKDPAYTASYLAWGNLGWAQVLSGDINAGIASLRNSVTQPEFCVGHYRLGVAYEKKGDMTLAERAFSDAVEVASPDCQGLQDAWIERGRVRMKLGRPADAKTDFEKCKDIAKDSPTGKQCVQLLVAFGGGAASDAQPAPSNGQAAAKVP